MSFDPNPPRATMLPAVGCFGLFLALMLTCLMPLVAVGFTWLLCPPEMAERVPIAYIAGILGPLVGADLLHLRDITRVPVGMLSIGGAGTFDGIVLSGILAALLA